MDLVVPLGVVFLLEFLHGVDVKQSPLWVEVFKDLDGGHIAVGGVDVLELGVPVFVQGIAQISCKTAEESFPDGPGFTCALPLLFHMFPGMCRGSISVIAGM